MRNNRLQIACDIINLPDVPELPFKIKMQVMKSGILIVENPSCDFGVAVFVKRLLYFCHFQYVATLLVGVDFQIGRASCRERV